MKQSVESSYAYSTGGRFYVFKESRKSSDDLSPIQFFGDFEECFEREVRFSGAACPWVAANLVQRELAFESDKHPPLEWAQFHNPGLDHVRRLRRSRTWF